MLCTTSIIVAVFAMTARAHPVADGRRVVGDLVCYPDHARSGLWHYHPARLELTTVEGRPGFSFHRYRYTGTSVSGDQGTFTAKAVLSFRVKFCDVSADLPRARTTLKAHARQTITLVGFPLEKIESRVVYVAGETAAAKSGDVAAEDSGAPAGGDALFNERTFSIGMTPATAQILWSAYESDQLALSLNYTFVGAALPNRPPPRDATEQDKTPVSVRLGGNALPIQVSKREHAACFVSTDLDAHIPANYPFLDIFCHDFQSAAAPTDLGRVLVDIKALSVTGKPVEKRIVFSREGPPRQPAHFEFAVKLDAGFEIRAHRIYTDGRVEEGKYERVTQWVGIRDVTRFTDRGGDADGAGHLDPRMLY